MKTNTKMRSAISLATIAFMLLSGASEAFAASETGAGMIGRLFDVLGAYEGNGSSATSLYRLKGQNIENDTVTKDEINNSTLQDWKFNQGKVFFDSTGKTGIGGVTPTSTLDVKGNAAIGTYAGSAIAPSGGMIVSGSVGIGTSDPGAYKMYVNGGPVFLTNEIYSNGTWSTGYGPYADGSPILFRNWASGELARINTTTGNMGIGTQNPNGNAKLDVNGSAYASKIVTTGNNLATNGDPKSADILIGSDEGARHDSSIMMWSAGSALRLKSTSSDNLEVSTWNNVGNPNVTLGATYNSDSRFHGNVINNRPSQGYIGLTSDLPGYANGTYPTLKTDGSYLYFSSAGRYTGFMGTDSNGGARLGLLNSAGTETVNVRAQGDTFFNGGYVGIGTSSPTYSLDVAGEIRAQNAWLRNTGAAGWYNETYGGGLYMQDTTWIRTYGDRSIWTNWGLLGSQGGLTVGYGGASTPSGGAIIAGNVGIGTSNPGANLQVVGTTLTDRLMVGGGGYGLANINVSNDNTAGVSLHYPGVVAWQIGRRGASLSIATTGGASSDAMGGDRMTIDTGGNTYISGNFNGVGAPIPANWYNIQGGSLGVSTAYAYSKMCVGNSSGDCNGAGGSVITSSDITTTNFNSTNVNTTNVNATNVTASIFIDKNDGNYYVDPNSDTNLNHLKAGNIAVNWGSFGNHIVEYNGSYVYPGYTDQPQWNQTVYLAASQNRNSIVTNGNFEAQKVKTSCVGNCF